MYTAIPRLRAILLPLAVHALSLTYRKLARTTRVSHEIVYGVKSWLIWASICALFAMVVFPASRGIVNVVIVTIAAAFKGVIESKPVSHLVRGCSRLGIKEDVAAIVVKVARTVFHIVGERAESINATAFQICLVIQIQSTVVALS